MRGKAVALLPEDPPSAARARVLSVLAQLDIHGDDMPSAVRDAERAVAAALAAGETRSLADARMTLGAGTVYLGEAERGLAILREGLAGAEGDAYTEVRALREPRRRARPDGPPRGSRGGGHAWHGGRRARGSRPNRGRVRHGQPARVAALARTLGRGRCRAGARSCGPAWPACSKPACTRCAPGCARSRAGTRKRRPISCTCAA